MDICPTLHWQCPAHPAWRENCMWFANREAGLHWYLVPSLALGIGERRLTQSQAPPFFLSVPSALIPKGPKPSTAFSSVLLWTSGIASGSSSSWSSSTFQPLKETLKQAMPWNYAGIVFVLCLACRPMEAGVLIPGQGSGTGLLNIAASQHWNNCHGMQLFHHNKHPRQEPLQFDKALVGQNLYFWSWNLFPDCQAPPVWITKNLQCLSLESSCREALQLHPETITVFTERM